MNRIVNFVCFSLLILAAWSMSYSLAYAEECRTAAELVDYVLWYGMTVVENGDKLHLSYQQPTTVPMFVTTVTEIWVRVGEGYCLIDGGHMS